MQSIRVAVLILAFSSFAAAESHRDVRRSIIESLFGRNSSLSGDNSTLSARQSTAAGPVSGLESIPGMSSPGFRGDASLPSVNASAFSGRSPSLRPDEPVTGHVNGSQPMASLAVASPAYGSESKTSHPSPSKGTLLRQRREFLNVSDLFAHPLPLPDLLAHPVTLPEAKDPLEFLHHSTTSTTSQATTLPEVTSTTTEPSTSTTSTTTSSTTQTPYTYGYGYGYGAPLVPNSPHYDHFPASANYKRPLVHYQRPEYIQPQTGYGY